MSSSTIKISTNEDDETVTFRSALFTYTFHWPRYRDATNELDSVRLFDIKHHIYKHFEQLSDLNDLLSGSGVWRMLLFRDEASLRWRQEMRKLQQKAVEDWLRQLYELEQVVGQLPTETQ
ncbi:MAG: hypothetical protein Q9208_007681 [Pyrenodesmia sp. 3 TL-2023]